jgi:hypothetical protein
MIVSSLECLPWLRDARKLLSAICGPQRGLITVTIHNSRGQGAQFLLPPEVNGRQATRPHTTDSTLDAGPRFRTVEQAALDAAEKEPIPVKALARKAGYKAGSYFSEAVTHLCRLGMLTRTPDGVCRRSD